jgi:hypothetical protein
MPLVNSSPRGQENTATIDVIPRDNNNSTDPSAYQVSPWYDRPKSVDTADAAPVRSPEYVTHVPLDKQKGY